MPRHKNIKFVIAPIIDELCEIYNNTNPTLGEKSEWDKLQTAQYSYDLFWKLYGELMIWAQNQIVGYEHAREDDQAAELVANLCKNGQIHENSHALEFLGAMETMRAPFENSKSETQFESIADYLESSLSDSALRRACIKMFISEEKSSLPIRERILFALRSINHGQPAKLFTPELKRRRGSPYFLDHTKNQVIMHLCYLEAKGFKTYKALERIGDQIASSPETIRTWKKELRHHDWFRFLWNSARIAGEYEELLLSDVDDGSDEGALAHEAEYYGSYSNIFLAMEFLRGKDSELSLLSLRKQLKEYRS